MFRIRFFTPSVVNDEGWQHAGGELVVGDARLCFLVDLTHWSIAEYQHQWRAAISRLVQGAPSTALMTAYRGRGDSAHTMWALWREEADVGERIRAAEHALPIPEWRVAVEHLHTAMLGIRWPKHLG